MATLPTGKTPVLIEAEIEQKIYRQNAITPPLLIAGYSACADPDSAPRSPPRPHRARESAPGKVHSDAPQGRPDFPPGAAFAARVDSPPNRPRTGRRARWPRPSARRD